MVGGQWSVKDSLSLTIDHRPLTTLQFLTVARAACYTVHALTSSVCRGGARSQREHGRVSFPNAARSATVTDETTELVLPSRIESVAEAAAAADEVARRLHLSEEAAYGLDMAVREAVTNAVLHGNRQAADAPVEITFVDAGAQLIVTVRDRGRGFDPTQVADPTDPANLLKASGRGILFMRSFMDEVEWTRHPEGGTVVRMTKKK